MRTFAGIVVALATSLMHAGCSTLGYDCTFKNDDYCEGNVAHVCHGTVGPNRMFEEPCDRGRCIVDSDGAFCTVGKEIEPRCPVLPSSASCSSESRCPADFTAFCSSSGQRIECRDGFQRNLPHDCASCRFDEERRYAFCSSP